MVEYNLGKVVGATGKGISSITKTSTSGLVDTYTVLFSDGTSTTFNVTNGAGQVVTSWEETPSDTKVASEKLVKNALDSKAESNHAHDSRYYTQTEIDTALVGKQATLVSGTNIKTINNNSILGSGNINISGGGGGADIVTSWESTLSDSKVPSEKLTKNTIDTKVTGTKVTSWSGTVADTNIPSEKLVKDSLDAKLSATKVTSWSGTVSDSNVPSEKLTKDTLDTKVTGTKVTSWSGTVADTNIPSEKLVKDSLDGKQATLVSGTNIKTINNNSLLGSGDITVGANVGSFTELQSLITNASSGDTIILDKDYKNTGSESEITIGKALTIIGNGHIIDADGKSRILKITSNGNGCKISDLIFINGKLTGSNNNGGAIHIYSSNTISNCIFINNSAYYGGAVFCDSTGNTISNCIFDNNSASAGGGIKCYTSTNIISCKFTNNSVVYGGGGINCTNSNIIFDCSFNNNATTDSTGYGGGLSCGTSNTISDCSFTNNSSNDGGGINASASNNIFNCNFAGNTADHYGANVYRGGSSTLTIYNCHVTTGLYQTVNKDDVNSDNLVTSWSSTVSDTNIASEKLVKDAIDDLQDQIDDIEDDMLN